MARHQDTRYAEARVRLMAHGKALRVSVGDQLVVSRLFRDDEGGRKLGVESEGTLGTSSGTDGSRTSVPDRL